MHFELFTPEISCNKHATNKFFREHKLTPKLMEQCYTYIASMTNFKYTDTGLIDGTTYVVDNFPNDIWHEGFHRMLLISHKGDLFPEITQTNEKYLPYCALVPYILAAHKLHNNISYEAWDKNTLGNIIPGTLRQLVGLKNTYIKDFLLWVRDTSLEDKSPKTTYGVYGSISKINDIMNWPTLHRFILLPTLAKIILTQIWCAHPSNRNNLMILDLNNWDSIPEPLEISDFIVLNENISTDFNPWNGMFEVSEDALPLNTKPLEDDIVDLPWDT